MSDFFIKHIPVDGVHFICYPSPSKIKRTKTQKTKHPRIHVYMHFLLCFLQRSVSLWPLLPQTSPQKSIFDGSVRRWRNIRTNFNKNRPVNCVVAVKKLHASSSQQNCTTLLHEQWSAEREKTIQNSQRCKIQVNNKFVITASETDNKILIGKLWSLFQTAQARSSRNRKCVERPVVVVLSERISYPGRKKQRAISANFSLIFPHYLPFKFLYFPLFSFPFSFFLLYSLNFVTSQESRYLNKELRVSWDVRIQK